MKKYVLFASAILAFASCASDSFTGTEEAGRVAQGEKPISFGSGFHAVTRADKTGNDAATDLSGQFYVFGIKNEGGTSGDGINAATDGNLVYNNYIVKWSDGSAMTSTSNTEGWEYVGYKLTDNESTNITIASAASPKAVQTIKYWDWGAEDYTFYAFSALPTDIGSGYVKVNKITSVTSPKTVYDKGYTVTLTADANLDKLFFAERVNVTDKDNTIRTTNKFGGNVTFRFHNTSTKVRVAMYEDIPGYKVTIDKFYVDANFSDNATANTLTFGDMVTAVEDNFAANINNCAKGTAGTLTVTYDSRTTAPTHNYPMVSFTGTANNVLTLGTNLHGSKTTPATAGTDLGYNITTAVYDKSDKSYTSVFPMENNTQNLKLKVDYTLTAIAVDNATATTREIIKVKGATAEISAEYLKWKPGYAYTYIFKISDNTNGQTGPGTTPAGLYPITFDAVEMVADDGKAEYITTVSEPTITTFGVKVNSSDKFVSYVTGGNEYTLPTGTDKLDIYATFMEGSTVQTPVVGGTGARYVNIYKVTCADETYITEAAVAEELGETFTGTPKLTVTNVSTDGTTNFSAAPDAVTSVPGEDGVDITQNAVKLTGVKVAGYYAIEYEASNEWTGTYKKVYKVIKVTAAP